MKTFLHLTTFLLLCLSSLALNAQSGNIVVFSPTGNHFYLTVDNKLQTAKPQKNVKVTGIPEGNSFIKMEFWNQDMPPIKQALTIEANKETSYILKKEGGQWVLEQYSAVPIAQVGNADSKQFVTSYNRSGVVKIEVDKVEDEPNIFVERSSNPANSTTNGVHTGGNLADRREGTFKITEKTGDDNRTATTPESGLKAPNPADYPQIAESISYKTETTKSGGMQIVEVKTITTKEFVEMNGQKFIKSKNEMRETVTNYQCVPMADADFEQASNRAQITAASILQNCIDNFSGKCLAANQAEKLKGMLPESDWNSFLETAKPQCADPNNCPFKVQPTVVTVLKEEPKVEPKEEPVVVSEPKEVPKPKTAKELKAELKAAKKREKEAAKAAKKAKK